MAMNYSISFSISTVSLLMISFAVMVVDGLRKDTIVGGITKVPNVKENKEVQELGMFSVEEYNRVQRGATVKWDLNFLKVVAAEQQVVEGMMYYIEVVAFEGSAGMPMTFHAQVWVKAWQHWKKLVKFTPTK